MSAQNILESLETLHQKVDRLLQRGIGRSRDLRRSPLRLRASSSSPSSPSSPSSSSEPSPVPAIPADLVGPAIPNDLIVPIIPDNLAREEAAYNELDLSLAAWLGESGFRWVTPGSGNGCPDRRIFDFPGGKVAHAARVDFYRGIDEDDPGNDRLNRILDHLPLTCDLRDRDGYFIVDRNWNFNNRANFVEACVGACFSIFTENTHQPPGCVVFPNPPASRSAMERVWLAFRELGFDPTNVGGEANDHINQNN